VKSTVSFTSEGFETYEVIVNGNNDQQMQILFGHVYVDTIVYKQLWS
jgi:hypothetical protein